MLPCLLLTGRGLGALAISAVRAWCPQCWARVEGKRGLLAVAVACMFDRVGVGALAAGARVGRAGPVRRQGRHGRSGVHRGVYGMCNDVGMVLV